MDDFRPIPDCAYDKMRDLLRKHHVMHLVFHYTFCKMRHLISVYYHDHDWFVTVALMVYSDRTAKYVEKWFCRCGKVVYRCLK
jgi:beta-mannanase